MQVLHAVAVAITLASTPQPSPPSSACVPPHDKYAFCNQSLPVAERATALASLLTLPELYSQLTSAAAQAAIPRLGVISSYTYGSEMLHGVCGDCPFPGAAASGGRCYTGFPTSSAQAAAFNRSLWHRFGQAQSDEARWAYNNGYLRGLHMRGPQLNPQRDPRWGRNDNSPGEDAWLGGEYGTMVVLGGQGAHQNGSYPHGEYRKVVHEMKHFTAYSVEAGRNGPTDTWNISLRDLAEYYFVPLKALIDNADVGAYMCSYNAINGTASCADKWMHVDVVKKHWGWSGAIESDCGAVRDIAYGKHGAYPHGHGDTSTIVGAAALAINATVDVDCGVAYTKGLPGAIDQNIVTRLQLEAAAARIFNGRIRIGEFNPNHTMYNNLPNDTIFSPQHQQLSLEAAQQSIVLLRNNPVASAAPGASARSDGAAAAAAAAAAAVSVQLPLKRGLKIAVVGPNGNSSSVYQGLYHTANCPDHNPVNKTAFNESSTEYTGCLPTAYDEIAKANAAAGGTTTFANGCSFDANVFDKGVLYGYQTCKELEGLDAVNKSVKEADVVVLVLGLQAWVTSAEETDRDHGPLGYRLPGQQIPLAQAVAAFNKPVVVVVLSGMAVGMDYIAKQKQWPVLIPGYGGRFGPLAIAQALFGDFSSSAKLPYTIYPESWAAETEMIDKSLTAGNGRTYKWFNYRQNASVPPAAFEFGVGTTYSTFEVIVTPTMDRAHREIEMKSVDNSGGQHLPNASFTVATTNTGKVAASDATLVYIVPPSATNISDRAPTPLPNKQLVNFVRTPVLEPGGGSYSETVQLQLQDFAMSNDAGVSAAYAGTYTVLFSNGAGVSSARTVTIVDDVVLDVLPPPYASKYN